MSQSTMMAASLAVSAVSAGANYYAQYQSAQQQAEYQSDAAEAAADNAVRQQQDLNARQKQEEAATALDVQQAKLKARRAQSTAKATSESAGTSFDTLMADYDRQFASYRDAQLTQLGWTKEQIERQNEAAIAGGQSRANSIANKPINAPSLTGTMLGFGADALNTVQSFQVRDPLTGKYTIN